MTLVDYNKVYDTVVATLEQAPVREMITDRIVDYLESREELRLIRGGQNLSGFVDFYIRRRFE